MATLPLGDYGIIGNRSSAALVSRLGSIDWCCMPFVDSPSHFGALLDDTHGGSFQVCPEGDFDSEQRYVNGTHVLQTVFESNSGQAILTDWMPFGVGPIAPSTLYRKLEVIEGEIRWRMQCQPRPGYGVENVQVERTGNSVRFRSLQLGETALLVSNQPLSIPQQRSLATATGTLRAGQSAHFEWIWGRARRSDEQPDPSETIAQWRSLAHHCPVEGPCPFAGPWHQGVERSALILRTLMPDYSGCVIESITTSLPSVSGGSKNWDLRYSWLRSTAPALQCLHVLGQTEDFDSLFSWLSDRLIRDRAESLQGVYTSDGGRYLPEQELSSWAGYSGSRPVRIGNLSARQFQLDTFGHAVLSAAYYQQSKGNLDAEVWKAITEITDLACHAWRRPDRGYWEVRARPQHHLSSKLYCWVAIDQACKLAQLRGLAPPRRWLDERVNLHRTICEQGFDTGRKSFVRAFGERELDGTALLIPLLGFLPFNDERVALTFAALESELGDGPFLRRSRSSDGLLDCDGAHLLTSLWNISCLALSGRSEEASDRLAEICSYASPLGLFAEQIDPVGGSAYGNIPSASAHIALINAAAHVGQAIAQQRRRLFKSAPLMPITEGAIARLTDVRLPDQEAS